MYPANAIRLKKIRIAPYLIKEMKEQSVLYIIPCPILDEDGIDTLPQQTLTVIHQLAYFIGERAKTTRRFIKATTPPYAIQDIHVEELDKHNNYALPDDVYSWMKAGHPIGLLSEAGCPCVADPGYEVVRIAREHNYEIIPLVGPSSLLLALMASGLNGQQFTFHGYLPTDQGKLKKQLRQMEESAVNKGYSQLFIETPYRNDKIVGVLLKCLNPTTLLNISVNLTADNQASKTMTVKEWKQKVGGLQLHKSPAVFIIGRK